MNERINELIKECTSVYDDLVYDGRDTCMKTTEYFDKEKFAELIVKECCDVLYDNEMGGYQVNHVLKEHFGIKR